MDLNKQEKWPGRRGKVKGILQAESKGNNEQVHNIKDSQTPNRKRSNPKVFTQEEGTDITKERGRGSIQWNFRRKPPKIYGKE